MTHTTTITNTLTRLRALEADHGPDGWPAVQMRDVSALLREVERLQALPECICVLRGTSPAPATHSDGDAPPCLI